MRTEQAAKIVGMAIDYRLASERRIAELETEVRMLKVLRQVNLAKESQDSCALAFYHLKNISELAKKKPNDFFGGQSQQMSCIEQQLKKLSAHVATMANRLKWHPTPEDERR